ncbi:ATP-binding protein [Saccharothrix deserti]|uniref:ATP-binding protein n=1 Tax=Saccharothrix deserti TaxID=2593674 RepID=UPI00131E648A|nr:BTAD domain-containing putative transcriptional regulator [Saccharothrix deserti]
MTVVLVLLSGVSYRDQEITRPQLRNLLALLADDLRVGCGTARLVEALWPDARPEHPAKALQVLVSHARAQLGSDVIAGTPTGYRLALREDEVDTSAVLLSASASARHSRTGDHAAALAHAEAGLALWEGAASEDDGLTDPLSALRAARASTYRSLVRARALALSRLGRRAEAVEPLTELVQERPRDEEVLVELLRCEAATVGTPAALARYDAYRRALRDELGSDPGSALQGVHRQLLQGDVPVVRHGVPHEPNPLLGRDDDIAAVANLLRTSRVTSIVGAGGLGKTRLAHAVSRRAEQRVVHLVALAGVGSDDDVVGEVASALGVGEAGRGPVGRLAIPTDVLTGIVNALGPGPALLVLDNCEHVVDGVAELVRAVVSTSEDLRVLTTSRAPLGLTSESVYLLPELSLPTAVELFTRRARAARPDVDLPADAVSELCGHLDGLPLAVELAAARVRVMSVAEISRHLDDRFALLRGAARDAPPRHRTLHAVIDWSWNLLEPAGQAAMRALSIFPGGFTADAARHLLGHDDVLPVVEQLVDQSLLKVTDTASGTRFRMLETVREFSTARREEAGESDRVSGRFLAWARDFGVAHHESVFGTELVSAVERIRAEQDNFVQALRHGLDRGDGPIVAATSAVLGGLWITESNLTRMATLAGEPASVLSRFRPEPALVEATRTAAVLCAVSGFLVQEPHPVRALVALRRLPPAPPDTLIRATGIVLRAVAGGSDLSALHALCDSDDPLTAGMANAAAGYFFESDNDLDSALKAARRMLAAFENRGIPSMRAFAHSRIGELCLQIDRADEARRHLGVALSVVEELGAWASATRLRWALVLANLGCGAVDEAEHWLEQAVRGGWDEAAGALMFDVGVRAEILLARGDVDAGLRLWRRAADRLRDTGSPVSGGGLPSPALWALEVRAVTVIAHAHHGRLHLVEEIAGELPHALSRMITDSLARSPESFVDLPVCGALLLAVAMVDLERGERTGDARATRSGVRMIALAERFGYLRGFQPTMSAARAGNTAEQADRSAYDDAVSSYADLGRDELRPAALTALRTRDQLTGPGPS